MEDVMEIAKENEPKVVNLILKTWTSDVGGIFDYSTKSVITVKDIIAESTYVIRDKTNHRIDNISQHSSIQNTEDLLFHVIIDINNNYSLYNPIPKHLKLNSENLNYLNNKIWYVIKSEEANEDDNCNEEYSISENDIIKFGKVKFAVQKIHFENENNEPATPIKDSKKYNVSELNKDCPPVFDYEYIVDKEKIINIENIDENENKDEPKCILCDKTRLNGDEEAETDRGDSLTLICLCNCKDKFLHLECLNSNMKEEKNVIDTSITLTNFQCRFCKAQYPLKYKIIDKDNKSKVFYTIKEYEKQKEQTPGDYMILESLDKMHDEQYCKSIHIINLNNEHITMGRGTDNNIVESDISISRNHAIFYCDKNEGKIYLKNKSKKFGTSVLVRKEISLLDKKIYLQVGRTYIEAYRGINEDKNN